jgi:signal transduction histidine kinase
MVAQVGGRIALAFAVAILLLIVNGVVSYQSVKTLIDNNERVILTQDVLEDLQELRTMLLQVESDARGYMLTGDPVYLDSYRSVRDQIPEKIGVVKKLTTDNESHQRKFPVLESAVASRIELLEEYIKRRDAQGVEAIVQSGRSAEGKLKMEAVRSAVNEIAEDERALLKLRVAESNLSGQRTLLTFIVANTVLMGLLILVFFLTVRDIRERRSNQEKLQAAHDRLEERVIERTAELNELNTELNRSNRELQDFAFVASHDLQEPLRKIQAFGDRLKTRHGPGLNDEALDYLSRMHGAAERMHTLINDLLTFSRVTTKAQPFVPTDLNEITRDVLNDLEVRLQDSGGRVEVGDLPIIDADALQMRQLFQNLIGNAVKFHRPDVPPIIRIHGTVFENSDSGEANGESRELTLTFNDNGIGFDEKYLDRIFTPFQRLHGRNEYEGTGIGLAVCRKIVERHGGTLTARSTPGEGSTFIAVLPVNHEKETT